MATVGIKLDIEPVLRSLDRLGIELAETAIQRSLNRTITGVRTAASRKVREELNLKAKEVNRDVKVRRARRGELEAAIDIQSQAVPLIRYGAKQTARGVTVKVKRRGGRKLLRGTFIATMKSGHKGVFARRGKARLPIGGPDKQDQFYSTSVAQFLDDERVLSELGAVAQDRFTRELSSQIDFLLR